MVQEGQLVMLVSPKGKRYMYRAGTGQDRHTNDGVITAQDILAQDFGGHVKSHLGRSYQMIRPTLHDLVKGVKRKTQIIYPKDIGYICMKLGIGPGVRVIEAGSGSGSLTVALSWFAGETGRVYTYERREEFYKLCRRNLEWAGVGENVEQRNHDIADGFQDSGVDALFLDVRTPWEYLDQAAAAVAPGAPLGFLLPTANQVSELLAGLDAGPFAEIEVLEILVRRYKTVAERFRPDDRMVAHTGYLIFARRHDPVAEEPAAVSDVGETSEPAEDATEPADAGDPDAGLKSPNVSGGDPIIV